MKEKNILLFTAADIRVIFGVSTVAAVGLLYRYTKQRLIVQVKRGLYTLFDAVLPDPYIANRICSPSYVSLAFALSYHGIIPEAVYEITSVSTKATRRFETMGKIFSYRKIKKNAYIGYTLQKQHGVGFYIADAEKAFVDETYLRLLSGQEPISRFRKEKINFAKVWKYALLFGNERLMNVLTALFK